MLQLHWLLFPVFWLLISCLSMSVIFCVFVFSYLLLGTLCISMFEEILLQRSEKQCLEIEAEEITPR